MMAESCEMRFFQGVPEIKPYFCLKKTYLIVKVGILKGVLA